jgi:hypothetical protein
MQYHKHWLQGVGTRMAATIITLIITLILGVSTFFLIDSFVFETSWKTMIVITVMVTGYTLVNEAIHARHID